ncbi:MAG: GFA family protein [Aestuariibacter sp.]
MSDTQSSQATCLCGKIGINVQKMSSDVGACHCDTCRKWTGGPLLAVDCHTDVTFTNEDDITRYASSDWAERGFCRHCGTHLFYKLQLNGQYIMPAGLFDKETQLTFDHQIFIEQKPNYYQFANDTKTMTGEEVFAQFNSE